MALMGYAVKVILKVFFGILENTSLMVRFQKTLAGFVKEAKLRFASKYPEKLQ